MKRRAFLAGLSGFLLPVEVDPERLNWRKGAKVLSFATPYVPIVKPTAETVSVAMAIWNLKMTMKQHGWTYVASTDIPVY